MMTRPLDTAQPGTERSGVRQNEAEQALREKVRAILDDTVDAELCGPFDDWVRIIPETLDAAADAILAALSLHPVKVEP